MKQTFKCDCGNVCTLKESEEQTEHYGDGQRGITTKCRCYGKVLRFG